MGLKVYECQPRGDTRPQCPRGLVPRVGTTCGKLRSPFLGMALAEVKLKWGYRTWPFAQPGLELVLRD
jgi:hypothetical protein